MARPNDTTPSGVHQRREPESRWSFIMTDGDENEEQYKVTLDEFIQFVEQRPGWLYQKIQAIHQRYDDCIDNCDSQIAEHEAWITEEELHSQIKKEELTVAQKELQNMKEHLTMAEQDWDIFANLLAQYAIEETSRIVQIVILTTRLQLSRSLPRFLISQCWLMAKNLDLKIGSCLWIRSWKLIRMSQATPLTRAT